MSTEKARALEWDVLSQDQEASFSFSVTDEDMAAFASFSGDRSRIHHNDVYAKKNGFEGPVVYGAIIVSKLSYFVGMLLPGDYGLANDWNIGFHNPLYVGDVATFSGEIVHLSAATRLVSLKVRVEARGVLIAKGTATSKLLTP